ncbi:hypothetical protein ANO11243_094720 [Dothideomycetidae sp. 11243]|nr:hypothetical protein ANO11243_094720 [fungal sp. No.11243]
MLAISITTLLTLLAIMAGSVLGWNATSTIDLTDRYIITLHPDTDLDTHLSSVAALCSRDTHSLHGIQHTYNISPSFRGYAGHFHPSVLSQLHSHPAIARIESDGLITLDALPSSIVTETDAPYGLNLISHRGLGQDTKGYVYDKSGGEGSFAYIIDTGIDLSHPEFGGRAVFGHNALKGSVDDQDPVGHGTHVAGIVGSNTFGVAKKCTLVAVKVFAAAEGTISEAMAGLDWSVNHILVRKRMRSSVVNMSFGAPKHESFNQAVDAAVASGITVVVSAGNSAADVGGVSPASAKGAIAVAATDRYRVRDLHSNFGKAVALFAPGEDILSTWPVEGGGKKVLSGTSMAAPFVTGLVAYLQGFKCYAGPAHVKRSLTRLATAKVVADEKGSPNLFAYNNGGSKWCVKG